MAVRRKRPRPMVIVPVRMPIPMRDIYQRRANELETDVSKEIRKVLKKAIMKRRYGRKKRFY